MFFFISTLIILKKFWDHPKHYTIVNECVSPSVCRLEWGRPLTNLTGMLWMGGFVFAMLTMNPFKDSAILKTFGFAPLLLIMGAHYYYVIEDNASRFCYYGMLAPMLQL